MLFDYIVVGAGSAGCVLASRLTEDPAVRVLLLEAGGSDARQAVRIPAAFGKLFRSAADWAYETEPQPALGGRRLFWPRGKMLGGSSSMNAMIYIRGHRGDYDAWSAGGNRGWSFAEVLPYFLRAEHQERGASADHGTDGPLNVADLRTVNPMSHAFVAAGAELGYPLNPDFNGPDQRGFGLYQVTQKAGRRHSAADAYLRPALGRPNLTVATQAHTTHLLASGGRIVGVEYRQDGQLKQARADREVLLSAGTINSAQLLLLSGIGPANTLVRLGIRPLVDLPGVGQHLQDHVFVSVAYASRRPVSLAGAESPASIARYLLFKRGPLTSNVAEAGAFVTTRPELPAPDLQFHFAPAYYLNHGFTRPPGHGFTIGPTLLRPRSRGTITLRTADPFAPPMIRPHYLEHPSDLETLVAGVELAQELADTAALRPFRGDPLHGPLRTRAAIADFVRRTVETIYHPAGTCRMGADDSAVVDAQLRVRGVDGLRVVDASVMPAIVGGNPNAVVIMLAERAADLIRNPTAAPDNQTAPRSESILAV